jgi:hypothetical protein
MEESVVLDLVHSPNGVNANTSSDAFTFNFNERLENCTAIELVGYSVTNAYSTPTTVGISRDPYFLVSLNLQAGPTAYVNGLRKSAFVLPLSQELASTDCPALTVPISLMTRFGRKAERASITQLSVRISRPDAQPIGSDNVALYDRIVLYLKVVRENNAINQPARQNMLNPVENGGDLRNTEWAESRRIVQQISNLDLY